MSNQWSDKLRKRMEMHQEPSPDGLWDDIEHIILAGGLQTPTEEPKRAFLWVKRISVAAILFILALSIGYITINHNSTHTQQVAEVVSTEETTPNAMPNNVKGTNKTKLIEEPNHSIISRKGINVSTSHSSSNKSKTPSILDEKKKENEDQNQPNSQNTPNIEETNQQKEEAPKLDKKADKKLYAKSEEYLAPAPDFSSYKMEKKQHSKWGTNLYAANLSPSANNKQGGYTNLAAYEMAPNIYEGEAAIEGNAFGKILLANQYSEVYTDIKHKQPIVVGATASYNLDNRWSLKSGVTYSYLSSKLHSGSDNNYYSSDQTLHFIGIPINVNYNIWDNKRLMVYASTGGMVEKNISGKLSTDYIVNNKLEHTKRENISIDRLQWSVNASVGAQYNITDNIGLYFEPGVNYHFKNNSKIETIYKEKPFNLSLRLGLNFALGGN